MPSESSLPDRTGPVGQRRKRQVGAEGRDSSEIRLILGYEIVKNDIGMDVWTCSVYGSLSIRMGHSQRRGHQTSVSAGQLQPELGDLAPGTDGGRDGYLCARS